MLGSNAAACYTSSSRTVCDEPGESTLLLIPSGSVRSRSIRTRGSGCEHVVNDHSSRPGCRGRSSAAAVMRGGEGHVGDAESLDSDGEIGRSEMGGKGSAKEKASRWVKGRSEEQAEE